MEIDLHYLIGSDLYFAIRMTWLNVLQIRASLTALAIG